MTTQPEFQYVMLKKILNEKITNLQDLNIKEIRSMFKVFLNGEWLGCIKEPIVFVNTLNSDVVKYVEENDNIVNENIFSNPNQKCESSNKTQLYHGIVNKEEIDKVLEYLESKTF